MSTEQEKNSLVQREGSLILCMTLLENQTFLKPKDKHDLDISSRSLY